MASVLALEWDGPLTWHFQRDNPLTEADHEDERVRGVLNHLHQYRRGRELFLAGPYDAMLVIESDIIPPPDTLKRLAAIDTDVAYGLYLFRRTRTVNLYEHYGEGARNRQTATYRHGAWEKAARGLTSPAQARRPHPVTSWRPSTFTLSPEMSPRVCDRWFTTDVYAAGFQQWADVRAACGHKDTDGTILWPPS